VLDRILIIKHGALGDIVLAMGAMRAIREAHPTARLTLLTRPEFAALMERSPYADEVWIDQRPSFWDIAGLLRLRRRILDAGFIRIYDLQTSARTRRYHALLGPGKRPEWCGHVRSDPHSYADPIRETQHTIDRLAAQLGRAGIRDAPAPDMRWAAEPIEDFPADGPFVALVPGSSGHRVEKRWPVEKFAALAERLEAGGLRPVIVAGKNEQSLAAAIAAKTSHAIDLAGRTSLGQIAWLGLRAAHAIGNDTGPMHVFAAVGCPATVLFSSASDPGLTAPRGDGVQIIQAASLNSLSVEGVLQTLKLSAGANNRRAAASTASTESEPIRLT
jgi:ADP-heptose:LPS heptosyltransferase